MVNSALSRYLKGGREDASRVQWFLGLPVESVRGSETASGMGGFEWRKGEVFWQADKPLVPRRDTGAISQERFRLQFWGVRPDFRFWTRNKSEQLIVEGKGTACNDTRDFPQAKRYFDYLREFPSTGAVVYLVARDSDGWLSLLKKAASETEIRFGVMVWTKSLLTSLSSDLVYVIEKSLAQGLTLLTKARGLTS